MAACTRCGFEQNGTQTYCKHCGMFLPTFAVYNPGQPEYPVAPEIASRQNQQFFAYAPSKTTPLLSRVIREVIALVGLMVAGFGLFGFFLDLLNGYWGLLFWFLLLLIGAIFVSVSIFGPNFAPRLRWLPIFLGALGATAMCVVLIIIVSAIVNQNVLGRDFGYGSTIFFYGLGIVALVLW